MTKEEKCPKCGAAFKHTDQVLTTFVCGTVASKLGLLESLYCLRRQLAATQAKHDELHKTYAGTLGEAMNLEGEVDRLRGVITDAIPALEAAAELDRACLGMVAPPVDSDGIPECEPWAVVDEMIEQFREAAQAVKEGTDAEHTQQ